MSVRAVARVMGISDEAAYRAVHDGTIPSIRFGRRLLVPTAALRKMLAVDDPRPAA